MAEHEKTDQNSDVELVAFCVEKQEFCVNIQSVREIRGWTSESALPLSPEYVRGVINLRGSVVPIVDLATRLGLETPDPTARHVIIITQVGEQVVGLLVDAVSDILTTQGDKIQATPDVASQMAKEFVKGVLPLEERMINLIELDAVLPTIVLDEAAA